MQLQLLFLLLTSQMVVARAREKVECGQPAGQSGVVLQASIGGTVVYELEGERERLLANVTYMRLQALTPPWRCTPPG